jgi:hypothetical protein
LSCLRNSAVGLGICCGNFLAIKRCFFILQHGLPELFDAPSSILPSRMGVYGMSGRPLLNSIALGNLCCLVSVTFKL